MHFSLVAALTVVALCGPALANPYIYKPVEASHYKAGDSFTVSWRDNGQAPLFTTYGQTTVALYTGSATVQTEIAQLGTIANPATDTETLITVDPTWGPDSDDYFIRIQSAAGVDSAGAPLQAFSARFSLTGMTGQWSSAVKAALASSATPAAGTAAASGTATAGTMATSVRATASVAAATAASLESKVASASGALSSAGSSSASAAGAKASASGMSGAAGRTATGDVAGLVGAAVVALVIG